jgi:hypothetical protein
MNVWKKQVSLFVVPFSRVKLIPLGTTATSVPVVPAPDNDEDGNDDDDDDNDDRWV